MAPHNGSGLGFWTWLRAQKEEGAGGPSWKRNSGITETGECPSLEDSGGEGDSLFKGKERLEQGQAGESVVKGHFFCAQQGL